MKDSDWLILSELYKNPNLTKVAELLYTTQPSLTKRIRHIEEEFGVTIVSRLPKGLRFTPEGEYLGRQADIYLSFLDETKREIVRMKGDGERVINIGSSYTFSKYDLGELMMGFRRLHRKARFNVVTEGSDSLLRRMLDGTVDMAFIRGDYDGSFNKILVGKNNAYVVTREPALVSDLRGMTRIGYTTNRQTQRQLDDWYEEQFGEPAPANMIVGYIDVAWQLVEKGAGYVCCFVPENYDGRGRLFLTPMLHRDGTPVCRNTWFFYPGEKNINETQQEFINYVEQNYKNKDETDGKGEII